MKLMPRSRASFTIRVVSSWPRLPMFILPPNCMLPSATSLTISPVRPSALCFIGFTMLQNESAGLNVPFVSDPPDRAVAIFGHEQRAVVCHGDAHRAAPDLTVRHHEAGHEVLILAGRCTAA